MPVLPTSGLPADGPPPAPANPELSADFAYEARVWLDATAGWITVAWCSTRADAELLAEARMTRSGCHYGEVWGPSQRRPGSRVALVRYDLGLAEP
jgi:hypothetical protein